MEPKKKLMLWLRGPVVILIVGLALLVQQWVATSAGVYGTLGYRLDVVGTCLVGFLIVLSPVRQRIRLVCDGKQVVLTTSIGLLGKTSHGTRIRWTVDSARGELRGPNVDASAQWINITIGGDASIPLRIYKPPLSSYFVAFAGAGLKQFEAQSNEYLWLWMR
jgi:hypothetical protein